MKECHSFSSSDSITHRLRLTGAGSDKFREPGILKMQLLKTPPEIVQSRDFWLLAVLVDA